MKIVLGLLLELLTSIPLLFLNFFPTDMYVSIRALSSTWVLKSVRQGLPLMETQLTTYFVV